MFALGQLVALCGALVGRGADPAGTASVAITPLPVWVVHIAEVRGTYPMSASVGFHTWGEADAFAQTKRTHGYLVRIEVR